MARTVPFRAAIAAALLVSLPAAHEAWACAFHLSPPEKTVVDLLIESDHIVAARPKAADPFRFAVVETLVDGGRTVAIERLVDSTARRRFARDPASTAIFAYSESDGAWRSLGHAGADLRALAERVIARRGAWQGAYHPERFAIAARLHDHADPALRRLALAELDRAPYAMLRGLEMRLGAHDLLADLWSIRRAAELPIRVLLLGLSTDESAHREIRERVEAWAGREAAPQLGAYATALIEIDGAEGLDRLAALYLADTVQPMAKIAAVVEAMAIHGALGPGPVRDRAAAALSALLEARPTAAEIVARQLAVREVWAVAPAMEALLGDRRLGSVAATMAAASYVEMARQADAPGWAGQNFQAAVRVP